MPVRPSKARREIVGVILAGGRGTRMNPISSRFPKPILPICNRPLLDYHLEMLAGIGISEVFIVVGHLGYEIALALGAGERHGLSIRYIEQKDALGIAHAVGQLQPHVKTPFFMILGDIFIRTTGLEKTVEEFRAGDVGSVVIVKEDDHSAIQKNFSVILDPSSGRVRRVIEKPRYVQNRLKGCGLYLFDLPIFDAIRRTPRTAMRDEYEITDSIQILIDDGEPVFAANVVDEDINLTTPDDLLRCNLMELDRLGRSNLVDAKAEVDRRASLRRCVVGPGARISGPVALENCVVFSGAVVERPGGGVVSDTIFDLHASVKCR